MSHEPAALLPNPAGAHHIWQRFTDGDEINHGQWLRACAEGGLVGECSCGGYLVPRRPEQVGGRTDYTATCRSDACGKEIAAPGGRLRTGSGRGRSGQGPARRGSAGTNKSGSGT